jgi:hypothetical protein
VINRSELDERLKNYFDPEISDDRGRAMKTCRGLDGSCQIVDGFSSTCFKHLQPSNTFATPARDQPRLERFFVQAEIGHQLLQPAVLVFQTPQPLRFPNLHPAVLALPAVQRRFRYSKLG